MMRPPGSSIGSATSYSWQPGMQRGGRGNRKQNTTPLERESTKRSPLDTLYSTLVPLLFQVFFPAECVCQYLHTFLVSNCNACLLAPGGQLDRHCKLECLSSCALLLEPPDPYHYSPITKVLLWRLDRHLCLASNSTRGLPPSMHPLPAQSLQAHGLSHIGTSSSALSPPSSPPPCHALQSPPPESQRVKSNAENVRYELEGRELRWDCHEIMSRYRASPDRIKA